MEILFIGGTGVISSACTRAAVRAGMGVTLVCRGRTPRPVPPGACVLRGDIRDPVWARNALGQRRFDVVVDWVAFLPEHVTLDIDLFRGHVGHYIFISSAAVYTPSPAPTLPITESSPRGNPHWAYARNKIACEDVVFDAFRRDGFPVTVVRASHTYDPGLLPVRGGWTTVDRMRRGRPVIVAGDGTSLWTLTHHEDFARALLGLFGLGAAIGEAVHITGDEALTWNRIYELLATAAGAELVAIHAPYELIAAYDAEWGASLLGDKAVSKVFDTAKIKALVPGYRAEIPYARGAAMQIAWYDEDPSRRRVDAAFNELTERLLEQL